MMDEMVVCDGKGFSSGQNRQSRAGSMIGENDM